MDIVIGILRLIHIFAGILWVGFGLFQTFYLAPAINKTGKNGYKFFQVVAKLPGFVYLMPIVAILTTVAGLLLYGMNSWHTLMNTLGGILLTVGALFGLLAFGHGFGLGAVTNRFAKAVEAWQQAGEPEAGSEYSNVQALGTRLESNARISAILMIIAVIGMASARGFLHIVIGG